MAYADTLHSEIEYLKGVGPKKAELLRNELGIHVFGDLLLHFPFRYIDRSVVHKIRQVWSDSVPVQLVGEVSNVKTIPAKKRRMVAHLNDGTGIIELVWFKGLSWHKDFIRPGQKYLVFGKPRIFRGQRSIVHPEVELYNEEKLRETVDFLQPVYNSTEKLRKKGLDGRGLMRLQKTLLKKVSGQVRENLPASLVKSFALMDRKAALSNIHFPGDYAALKEATRRLKFEELFMIQVRLLYQKNARQKKLKGHIFSRVGEKFNYFYKEQLPFEFTGAQKRVIREVRRDVKSGMQMNRLLQGDVGSGKTIVALMGMLLGLDNDWQAAMMAPTGILAAQHFNNIRELVKGMDLNIRLLTGSTKAAERKNIFNDLATGTLDILIGTHALIEEKVQFGKLGLVVIDEQHRFGVAQRARLWTKGKIPPHVLVMTATPIPRTLAMTLYGDLETSVIDELPPGRKHVKTFHVFEDKRLRLFGFLKEKISEGRQVFIVYPLIEESEKMDYKNLMEGYDAICREFQSARGYQVGIVHGRMKPEDKDYEMQRFKKGKTHILVSTTVIEVGVDVPNATVMVIESAERFGLSQLHQLRGRVGRSATQSFCMLVTSYKLSQEARTRMNTMVKTNNGFEIAEVDLRLRGPGDITGTRQSGILNLKVADLNTDQRLLVQARTAAQKLLDEDPGLANRENKLLKKYIVESEKNKTNWGLIS